MRVCEICGKRAAKYVCQRCGAVVCEVDFDPFSGLCVNCVREVRPSYEKSLESGFPRTPLIVLILGIVLIFLGFALVTTSAVFHPSATFNITGGGIILIGPLPIVFGFGELSWWLILVLMILAIIIIALYVFLVRRTR